MEATVTQTPQHEGTWSYEVRRGSFLIAIFPVNYLQYDTAQRNRAVNYASDMNQELALSAQSSTTGVFDRVGGI